jgi:hypothetical protein
MRSSLRALVPVATCGALLGAVPSASATVLQMPFKCNTTVLGQARADHVPAPAIDFNGTGGGDTDLGMPIVAAGPGKVTVSTYYTSNGYGNAIEIRHPDGRSSFYAHLRDRQVGVGKQVRRGQLIGHLGKSSAKYTFTAHLHYEERQGGSAVQAHFNRAIAPVYARMEASVPMTSRNCGDGGGGGNPTPAPSPAPAPAPAPAGGKGVPLPKRIKTRRAAQIQTDNGIAVSGRRAPRTAAREAVKLQPGQNVKIVCQTRGERVTGKFGTSNLWDLVVIGKGRGVYVTDTYVFTGSDGRVAPRCPR